MSMPLAEARTMDTKEMNPTVKRAIANIQGPEDLNCKHLRDFIIEEGQRDPRVLIEMIKKSYLNGSALYIEILQKLGEAYKIATKPQEGPLECWMNQWDDEKKFLQYSPNTDKLMSITEILMTIDNSQEARTRCLRRQIITLNYIPQQNLYYTMEWTDRFRQVLKFLLEGGADPTWTPKDSEKSALYYFFQSILHLIVNEDDAIHSIMELLPLLLTDKSLNSLMEKQVNPLIALFDIDFPKFFKDLNNRVQNCGASISAMVNGICEIVTTIVGISPDLVHKQDIKGHTVLHQLGEATFLYPNFMSHFVIILPIIISEKSVNAIDCESVTPYSWISRISRNKQNYPKGIQTRLTNVEETFLEYGADEELAKNGNSYTEYKELDFLLKWATLGDWFGNVQRIMHLVTKTENLPYILKKDEMILVHMVNLTSYLMVSPQFVAVVQKIAETCLNVKHIQQKSPIQDLVKLMNEAYEPPQYCYMHPPDLVQEFRCLVQVIQHWLLKLIEILITTGDQINSSTECLRAIIMNAKYTSWQISMSSRPSWLHWTSEFIHLLKHLLSTGADPTWIPEGSSKSSLHQFFQAIIHVLANHSELHGPLIELLPMFLTEKSLTWEEKNGTVLHALVGTTWERLPDELPVNFVEQYQEVILKIINCNQAMLDTADSSGRTPLQCFLDGIKGHKFILKHSFEIVKMLRTDTNVDVEDKRGRTALHYLLENLPINGFQNYDIFCELLKLVVSQKNVDKQDVDGESVIHVLARTVQLFPSETERLLETFSLLSTSANVNATDNDNVTPYSWILSIRHTSTNNGENTEGLISRIEKVFKKHGANPKLAQKGLNFIRLLQECLGTMELQEKFQQAEYIENPQSYPDFEVNYLLQRTLTQNRPTASTELALLVNNLKTPQNLDKEGENILQMFAINGCKIIRREPIIFNILVGKANVLIASRYYMKIIKIFADAYRNVSQRLDIGPMSHLADKINHSVETYGQLLLQHPDRFLSLLKILTAVEDNFQSRTVCFQAVVMNTRYIADPKSRSFNFNAELLDTLKVILKKGANLTLSPRGQQSDKSAGYIFFQNIFNILANESHLFNQLLGLVPLLVASFKDIKNGSALHALMSCEWRKLYNDISTKTVEQYKQIISKVINLDPTAVNVTNAGTPLHLFLSQLKNYPMIFLHVYDVVKILRTEKNIDEQDRQGRTPLHYLCELLPMNCVQDVPENFHDVFLDLIKQVKSSKNIDIQDENGQTALHILLMNMVTIPEVGSTIQPIIELLATAENVNAIDRNSVTPYSWLCLGKVVVHKKGDNTKKNMFSTIEELFLEKGADDGIVKAGLSSTMLSWFGRKLPDASIVTLERLHALLTCFKAFRDVVSGCHSNCKIVEYGFLNRAIFNRNPILSVSLQEIVNIAVSVQWTGCVPYHIIKDSIHSPSFPTSTGVGILSICLESGVQLPPETWKQLLGKLECITGHEEYDEKLVKALVTVCQKQSSEVDQLKKSNLLDFLGDRYIISKQLQKLSGQLVYKLYESVEECMASYDMLKCFLFLAHKPMNIHLQEGLFRNTLKRNTFNRSPLHLVAILLDDVTALECLPKNIVQKYINARDLHGCTPLHLAHLHHNEKAIAFLMEHGAENDVIDSFGRTPENLGSRVGVVSRNGVLETVHYQEHQDSARVHMDVKHYQICCRVMSAEYGVLSQIRPMLVMPETETKHLREEMKLLFQHLLKETKFHQAEICVAGSIAEKLKAGRLDEVDVQIRLKGIGWPVKHIIGENIIVGDFIEEIIKVLQNNVRQISWKGLNLRPIYLTSDHPWKFLREGNGSDCGIIVSVDIATVLIHNEEEDSEIEQKFADIVEGASMHYRRSYTLRPKVPSNFAETTFALEWDILDSLPTAYRLAIVLSKSLVQAYEWSKGDRKCVEMPISSYMVKTSLFFILNGKSDVKRISEALKYSTESINQESKETEIRRMTFCPNPKWITEEDIDHNAEDARIIAMQIFRFIHYLAKRGCKVLSYWREPRISRHNENCYIGESAYVCDICESLLDRLEKRHFYPGPILS